MSNRWLKRWNNKKAWSPNQKNKASKNLIDISIKSPIPVKWMKIMELCLPNCKEV